MNSKSHLSGGGHFCAKPDSSGGGKGRVFLWGGIFLKVGKYGKFEALKV